MFAKDVAKSMCYVLCNFWICNGFLLIRAISCLLAALPTTLPPSVPEQPWSAVAASHFGRGQFQEKRNAMWCDMEFQYWFYMILRQTADRKGNSLYIRLWFSFVSFCILHWASLQDLTKTVEEICTEPWPCSSMPNQSSSAVSRLWWTNFYIMHVKALYTSLPLNG